MKNNLKRIISILFFVTPLFSNHFNDVKIEMRVNGHSYFLDNDINTGMEYFNSFGGNPVSCAVGQAVLDVIKDESLQDHALKVGDYFLEQLQQLKQHHEIIGDVRGRGLFIGIELNRDEDLTPADTEVHNIINRMKEKGVLLSTDGPDHNVIKIKPPIVFNIENAEELVKKLDETMTE